MTQRGMAMRQRADIHRPAEIQPADYEYLFSFSYMGLYGDPEYNVALLVATQTGEPQKEDVYGISPTGQLCVVGTREVQSPWGKLQYFEKENGKSGCDICGAHYRHGDVFRHKASGECIQIGHICADKMHLVSDRSKWVAARKSAAELKKSAERKQKQLQWQRIRAHQRREKLRSFLRNHRGIGRTLKGDHHILRDLRGRLIQYGSLSPAQIDLAERIHGDLGRPEIKEVMPPNGRVEVTGTIMGFKEVESDYGSVLKMILQVNNDGAGYRLFGTVPQSICDQAWEMTGSGVSSLRGATVKLTANVQPKEAGFGFYSRPTKSWIVQVGA